MSLFLSVNLNEVFFFSKTIQCESSECKSNEIHDIIPNLRILINGDFLV